MGIITNLRYIQKKHHITAPSKGKIIRIENIPDKAFSHKMIGDGLAMQISAHNIYSPCDGVISTIATTKHAFIITLEDGAELLIHIGLNRRKTNINDYKYHVQIGDMVNRDTLILTLSDNILKSNNNSIIIPIILLNYNIHPIRTLTIYSNVDKGEELYSYK